MRSKIYIVLLILYPIISTIFLILGSRKFSDALLSALPMWAFLAFAIIGIVQYLRKKEDLVNVTQNKELENGAPVRYCSESRFRKFWCLYPWESSGLLVAHDKTLLIYLSHDHTMKIEFHQGDRHIRWIGPVFSKGASCWFQIQSSGKSHYFTYDSGATIFFSHELTKSLYNYLEICG